MNGRCAPEIDDGRKVGHFESGRHARIGDFDKVHVERVALVVNVFQFFEDGDGFLIFLFICFSIKRFKLNCAIFGRIENDSQKKATTWGEDEIIFLSIFSFTSSI